MEVLIALVLGLLIAEGIFILFASAGRANAMQAKLSQIEETGRDAMAAIGDDLRLAGRQPCGAHLRPLVYAEDLAAHVAGANVSASSPAGSPESQPYALDGSLFLHGNTCRSTGCVPDVDVAQGVPSAGLREGDRVPGTDVLTVRHLGDEGWFANSAGSSQICSDNGKLDRLVIKADSGDHSLGELGSGHLAMLAGCTSSQIFRVKLQGTTITPAASRFGEPVCVPGDAQSKLFDFDAQLVASTFYLQLVKDDRHPTRLLPALMQRTNGTVRRLALGVERLDLEYSLIDAAGMAHWLGAGEVAGGRAHDGAALWCANRVGGSARCGWGDVSAVAISILVDSLEGLPADAAETSLEYRYSFDGNRVLTPAATMPVTGLPSGRMLRHEFHTVVALRNLGP